MENTNNTNDANIKGEIEKKEEINENEQDIVNGQEQENNNNNENGEKDENNKWNGQDLDNYTVEELKEELKNRKIEFPKNAKKKELQELLINSK